MEKREKGDMIHIAVMGFGTVGAGVAEILQTNGALGKTLVRPWL